MPELALAVTAIAAVKIYVALQHLALWAGGAGHRRDLAFAATCALIAAYDLAAAGLYRATSVEEAAGYQHLQMAALVAASAAFLWFTGEYTRRIPRRVAWVMAIPFSVTSLIALLDRSGLVFDAGRPAVKEVVLPLGIELTYLEASAGPLVAVQSLIGVGLFACAFTAAVRQFRAGERQEALPLLGALGVLFLGVANDSAVALGLYDLPYTLEFAYLSLVVVMALALVRQLAAAAGLESRLRESEDRLRHAERLEALGTLAGGVAHDFNNLLVPIVGHAELALSQLGEDHPARTDLVGILRAGESAARLTRQLLQVAAGPRPDGVPADLGTLIKDFRPVLRGLLGHRIRLEVEVAPGLPPVALDPGRAQQILLNLAANARDAMPEGGTFRVVARSADGDRVLLVVEDTGCGMEPEVAARAFDPFFTTRERNRGTGLGLATTHRIVTAAGGEIRLDTRPGSGTRFEIALPAAPFPRRAARETPAPRTPPEPRSDGGGRVVLVVEDDPAVRATIRRVLDRAGYRVLDAATAERGLELEARHEGPLHCVVTDVLMPGMDGYRLAAALRARRPGVGVVLVSGRTGDRAAAANRGALPGIVLPKPFAARALEEAVARAAREPDTGAPAASPAAPSAGRAAPNAAGR